MNTPYPVIEATARKLYEERQPAGLRHLLNPWSNLPTEEKVEIIDAVGQALDLISKYQWRNRELTKEDILQAFMHKSSPSLHTAMRNSSDSAVSLEMPDYRTHPSSHFTIELDKEG